MPFINLLSSAEMGRVSNSASIFAITLLGSGICCAPRFGIESDFAEVSSIDVSDAMGSEESAWEVLLAFCESACSDVLIGLLPLLECES